MTPGQWERRWGTALVTARELADRLGGWASRCTHAARRSPPRERLQEGKRARKRAGNGYRPGSTSGSTLRNASRTPTLLLPSGSQSPFCSIVTQPIDTTLSRHPGSVGVGGLPWPRRRSERWLRWQCKCTRHESKKRTRRTEAEDEDEGTRREEDSVLCFLDFIRTNRRNLSRYFCLHHPYRCISTPTPEGGRAGGRGLHVPDVP